MLTRIMSMLCICENWMLIFEPGKMYRTSDMSFVNLRRQRERPLANSWFVYVNKLVIVILVQLWSKIFVTN